ncbi:hypothetical protein ACFYO2_44365 [Streptomyces sp. NPDC006602]|uniref:AraC-like ligand-binding domain-containing protein n=1 Tax=Streptomyces sp. NPDC006602 TaxID=3364751 RepID=UPI00368E674F
MLCPGPRDAELLPAGARGSKCGSRLQSHSRKGRRRHRSAAVTDLSEVRPCLVCPLAGGRCGGAAVQAYPSLRSRRTSALVRRSDPELYHLALTLRGRQGISHGRRDASVGVGDLLLYDTSHPCDASAFPDDGSAVEGIVVNVPRAAFPIPAAKVDRLLGVPLIRA